jgi:hypothetical protein
LMGGRTVGKFARLERQETAGGNPAPEREHV